MIDDELTCGLKLIEISAEQYNLNKAHHPQLTLATEWITDLLATSAEGFEND